jgi:hypothetical protein
VDEIPFDFERRRMSVVVKEQDDAHQLICKGALQEILNVSTQVRYNGDIVPLDDTMLRRIRGSPTPSTVRGCAWWRWRPNICRPAKATTSAPMSRT